VGYGYEPEIGDFFGYHLPVLNKSPTQKVWISYIWLKELNVSEKLNNAPLFIRNATNQLRPSIFIKNLIVLGESCLIKYPAFRLHQFLF
jgi:hypothetical protein